MSNKKMILGIAAGVAALAIVGIILKRKGYLDGLSEKADELGSGLKDKFRSVKESAKRKFDEVVEKGGDIAHKLTGHEASANGSATTQKAAGTASGSTGNINPATT